MSDELIFSDREGRRYRPVKQVNRASGRLAFHIKPVGGSNRSEDALPFESVEELARAMLIDHLSARVEPVDGGHANYLRFGADKLVGYQLDEGIARRLGIPESADISRGESQPGLERLKARFLKVYPDFEAAGQFRARSGTYQETFRQRVDALIAQVASRGSDAAAVLNDLLVASRQRQTGAISPFLDGDVIQRTPRARAVDPPRFDAALSRLLGATDDPPAALEQFNADYWALLQKSAEGRPHRDTRVVPTTLLALVAPERAISVRYQPYSNASKLLHDRFLFADKPMTAVEYREVLALAERMRGALVGWGWQPRDLWDVHGFILATCAPRGIEASEDVFEHFDVNPAFAEARQAWTEAETAAFVAFVRAIHSTGLDWYFVGIRPYQLRFGRKPGAADAQEVVGYLDGGPPRIGLRRSLPEELRTIEDGQLVDDTALAWAEAHQGLLAKRSEGGRDGLWPDQYAPYAQGEANLPLANTDPPEVPRTMPTNLILYGPPGTGKTHRTAWEAVRLCGEDPPADRAALMARYRELSAAGRIEFVTFHQSMAYEDFVEGLRPTSTDEDGNALPGGFLLAATPGIFRTIAKRAETSTGPSAAKFTIGDRKVFKMSLGEAANPDDAHLFEESIKGDYIVLGFEDVDWSDRKYADRDAILAECQSRLPGRELNAQSAVVQMPNIFRNWMRIGDVVVVSKGTKLFRAIGVITGDYRFLPRDGGDYAHQRTVRWLWVDRAGVPVKEIYARNFSQRTITETYLEDLNIPALERYANSQQKEVPSAPEPFVLVIDEINRANISKVFGELITLLEPDKRLGQPNELRVRLPYSGDLFGVPANLHIVATMNTADRSIALIDKALRRRFEFREMLPDYGVEGLQVEVNGAGVTLAEMLRTLNDRIEYFLDREHQIGHAWLLGCSTKEKLDAVMQAKIIPLIAEYFFEDWGRTADVLGARQGDNPFLEKQALNPPPGMAAEGPRHRWTRRTEFAADAYLRLVGRG